MAEHPMKVPISWSGQVGEGKLLKLERIHPNLAAKLAQELVDGFQDILELMQKEVASDKPH